MMSDPLPAVSQPESESESQPVDAGASADGPATATAKGAGGSDESDPSAATAPQPAPPTSTTKLNQGTATSSTSFAATSTASPSVSPPPLPDTTTAAVSATSTLTIPLESLPTTSDNLTLSTQIPAPPSTMTAPTYPFTVDPAASQSHSHLRSYSQHQLQGQHHARVNSSAEDWTPVGDLTSMNAAANASMTMEGERTLVEDEMEQRRGGVHRHRKEESGSSLSLPVAAPTMRKGHSPKMMSQSSAAGERWDPLQRRGEEEASDLGHGHDRDRTVVVEDPDEDAKRGRKHQHEEEQDELDLGADLDRHLHEDSAGTDPGRKLGGAAPRAQAARRASHLRLDIHPPASPPPWETVDPPSGNNSKNVAGYYSPATSKFRTLQSGGPRSLIPKSSYYFGPPPPDSAYGTAPIGQIGVHHPREILRVERDYTCGEITQFAPIYPLELEGRITPTHFLESINAMNELLISAHSIKHAMFDNMLAILSLQISRLFVKSHFEKEMLRLRELIDELNVGLYNPVGLNILYPRDVAFLYLEIEYY